MRISIALLISACLACLPAQAGETAWQEIAPGVAVRLISAGAPDASGKALFALEIDMPEDTKTYWRVPGETGLPLELDFAGSRGVTLVDQHWPLPQREKVAGYLDYVYYGHTVLPLELAVASEDGLVDIEATLGVCSDICMPAQARLTLPLAKMAPDSANALRIDQALADVPIAWDGAGQPIGLATLLPDAGAIAVEIDPTLLDPSSLIAATDLDGPLFGAPQKSPQDNLVLLPILGKTDNSALEGMEVEFSFMSPRGAYQVSRTLETGPDADVDELAE
ncbi:MAG: protein-disulfide reductase DsbD family protein [Devosia marina]|uniref:protein-disulfide reductase DsbD domain-containing protein n=1 Tax=Devosia marina TaxID=2683198 RepID=UPI0032EF0613